MTRLILFVLSALLALLSVVHAKSDQIRAYAFTSDYCYGPPAGSNLDIKRDKCKNIPNGARSIKPMLDPKRDGWVDEVNKGATFCQLITYQALGCDEDEQLKVLPVPEELDQCQHATEPGEPISLFSVKFECESNPPDSTMVYTSWSFGDDEKPTPHVTTTTYTFTPTDERRAIAQSLAASTHHLEPRSSKEHHNSKGVWMLHPWSRSLLCYECWTMKADNFDKLRCHSGPKNVVNCGTPPENGGEETTITHSQTTVVFDLPTTTKTWYELTTSTIPVEVTTTTVTSTPRTLEERGSWHRRVTFYNPYKPGTRVCGSAEWEKRGQPNTEIRVSKVGENMSKCDKAKAGSIDVPIPVHETVFSTSSAGIQSNVYTTTTVFVVEPDTATDDEDDEGLSIPAHRDL